MREKYLLGSTTWDELAFAECEIRNDGEFSCSFDTVIPFNSEKVDLEYYAEELLEYLDNSYIRSLCKRYDCKESELAVAIATNEPITELMDCSLYPEFYTINGNDWYFESSGCGQIDLEGNITEYTNKDAVDKLIKFWKEHHLTIVDDTAKDELKNILSELSSVDEKQWIIDYIQSDSRR